MVFMLTEYSDIIVTYYLIFFKRRGRWKE